MIGTDLGEASCDGSGQVIIRFDIWNPNRISLDTDTCLDRLEEGISSLVVDGTASRVRRGEGPGKGWTGKTPTPFVELGISLPAPPEQRAFVVRLCDRLSRSVGDDKVTYIPSIPVPSSEEERKEGIKRFPPGSRTAQRLGCICPIDDNSSGEGWGVDPETGQPTFVQVETWQLHGWEPGMPTTAQQSMDDVVPADDTIEQTVK